MSALASIRHAGRRLALLLEEKPGTDMTRRHGAMLAAVWAGCTLLLFLFRPGYMFPPYGGLDGWIYTAYQWDLRAQIADFGPTYYGSRLSWILPGALLHTLLPLFAAEIAYKLIVSGLLAAACTAVVYRTQGLGAALLTVALSVLAPQVIQSMHTDYIDTAVYVYGALALACITLAKDSRRWRWLIFAAGCFYTCMVIANLSALSSLGVGIAVYHLCWLRWDLKRHAASILVYLLAAVFVCIVLGLLHRAAGGDFNFLKPQFDMLTYMRGLKENPWIPKDPLWFTEATWLLLISGVLCWGAFLSLAAPPADERKRLLLRSLTAGLAVSFLAALALQVRELNATLSFSFYATFHLCLALPLLAVCWDAAESGRPGRSRWLLFLLAALAAAAVAWRPAPVCNALFERLPFLHSFRAVPLLFTGLLLPAAALAAVLRSRHPAGITGRILRAEWLVLGLVLASMSIELHGPSHVDRLRERYGLVHDAYRKLAKEFPAGSYRFWVHPEEPSAVSLASTKLWGYRLFSLEKFPKYVPNNLTAIAEDQILIVPAPPQRGPRVLKVATEVMRKAGYSVESPRVIVVPGAKGLGFDLVCFQLRSVPLDPEAIRGLTESAHLLLELDFETEPPYTSSLAMNIYGAKKQEVLDTTAAYPVFTRTDQRDHLATPFLPLPEVGRDQPRQVLVVATMPTAGHCVGVFQIDDCVTIAQITWHTPTRSVHTITIPAKATTFRIYLQSRLDQPTALPTHIAVYEIPPGQSSETGQPK